MLSFILLLSLSTPATDWPEFRGPTGQGHSDERDLPVSWSERRNITWKVPIEGRGWSSPVLAGDQIWLTTAADEDRSLRALCLDRRTGGEVHDVELFLLQKASKIHGKNTPATPTPIIEGDRVYFHFGTLGTACLSTAGEVIWSTQKLKFDHGHGPGGSPALYKDLLLINCDGQRRQFVVALDKKTGKVRWRKERDGKQAYSTPLVIRSGEMDQMISTGGEWVVSYRPATGEEIWRLRYPAGYSLVPRPVHGHGLVYICSGFSSATLFAIRPDGNGDVTGTHVAWKMEKGVPKTPSPILIGERLYVVSDNGILTCLQARTGRKIWQNRLKGNHSASPVFAGDHIYFLNEDGVATVLEPGDRFKPVASNRLNGRTLASLAVSDGAIYLRSDSHLYRIEEK